MRFIKLTTLAAALGAAVPAFAADATLGEIVVHSERDDFEARQASTTTKLVYGREELDRMNELTVGDYLRRLPSVTFTGPPGTPKDVRVRGMDKGYTEILIDGEPVATGTKERQIQVDRLPIDLVERIELIRAPGADLSNEGMMGAINIVLREVPKQRVANARLVAGRVFGEKADKDTWNLSGQYGNASGDVRWLLNASVGQRGELKTKSKDETNYANTSANQATARNLELEDERVTTDTLDFSPRLNLRLSAADELVLTPWITRSDETKIKTKDKFRYVGSPFTDPATIAANGRTHEAEDKLRQTVRLRGEWKHKLQGGGFSIFAAAQQGGEKKDKTVLDYNAAGTLTKTTLEKDDKDEREWYLGGKWERKLGKHKLGAGLEYKDKSREDVKTRSENGVPKAAGRGDNFDISERRWTAWLQGEIDLGGGHFLTPGVRALRNERSAKDGLGVSSGGTVQTVTPSLHHLWRVDPRNNLRASVTQTLKPPKFDDLSTVTDTKTGTLGDPDKSGNPDLKPEKALGVELGWEHFLPRGGGVLGFNLFGRDIEDMVQKRTALEGPRYVERPQNVGDSKVWGWELDARPRMDILGLPELMLRFNYTRLFSEIESSPGLKTRISDQPPYVYNIGFDWQLPRWEAAWGVNYNYSPKFLKNPTEPLKRDDEAEQKLLDLYVMKRINKDLALRLTAANLLDMAKDKDKYEYHATTGLKTKFTQESEKGGRAFYLALEGKW